MRSTSCRNAFSRPSLHGTAWYWKYPRTTAFVRVAESNPVRHSRVNSPRSNHTVLDPIVDDLIARAKLFCHLLDRQLLRPLELGRWNPIPATDPLDDLHRVRPAFGADLS